MIVSVLFSCINICFHHRHWLSGSGVARVAAPGGSVAFRVAHRVNQVADRVIRRVYQVVNRVC
jgi:hypothetical protein